MSSEFLVVKREDLSDYNAAVQAAHCMVYARLPPDRTFEGYPLRAAVLMQMRFDGHVGFPGGLIEDGEDIVQGLIREMQEEINFSPEPDELSEKCHVVSHWRPKNSMLLHFYVCEVSPERLKEVEHNALNSHDYGGEVMGTFRVPLYTMSNGFGGFPTFLQNSFVGIAREQLRAGLLHTSIMTKDDFKSAEEAKVTVPST